MISFDKEKLIRILIDEEQITNSHADFIADLLSKVDSRLQGVLNQWMDDRTIADYEVEGVTIDFIMSKERTNFHSALLKMNIFVKNPYMAREYLETPTIFYD